MAKDKGENKKIQMTAPLKWRDDSSPVVAANQFILQPTAGDDNSAVLVVGHASMPLVTGSPQDQRKQIEEMGGVPVHVRGRFRLNAMSLATLRQTLDQVLPKVREVPQ